MLAPKSPRTFPRNLPKFPRRNTRKPSVGFAESDDDDDADSLAKVSMMSFIALHGSHHDAPKCTTTFDVVEMSDARDASSATVRKREEDMLLPLLKCKRSCVWVWRKRDFVCL